jgi:hypothetical protein
LHRIGGAQCVKPQQSARLSLDRLYVHDEVAGLDQLVHSRLRGVRVAFGQQALTDKSSQG